MSRARPWITVILALSCRRGPTPMGAPTRHDDIAAAGSDAPSVARPCAGCHAEIYARWLGSQHAQAQRPLEAARDPQPAGVTAAAVIGVAPLRQSLVRAASGRVQVFDPAFDPARRQWFSVFGDTPRPSSAWGHWTQRGMNWNSQCAFCHTTDLAKNYDPRTDSYATTWRAAGIACAQCHEVTPDHATRGARDEAAPWRARANDTCASCHARREELTGRFRAGERFDDHYRPSLADTPGAYHPDGASADENFEYGSLLLSPMGQRGVQCLDCHEPHGGGLRAPLANDGTCRQCHNPQRPRGAPFIEESHSHHPTASAGARCVNCHMPEATFMQRDRRRDHGFTVPDPTLSRELGVPNACNGCHADRSVAWAEEVTARWYGSAMERPARARARIVARVRRGDESAIAELLRSIAGETVDAWRASLVAMLAPWSARDEVRATLLRALEDRSPLVQVAAARALGEHGEAPGAVRARCTAPLRAVRVEAAWALRASPRDCARADLLRWIAVTSDQPAGALRRSEFLWRQGRAAEATEWAERAARWDPSGTTLHALGRLRDARGDVAGALEAFASALRAEPENADHPYARGLVLAAAGRTAEAVADLEAAVARDPGFGRAHYNLGLARAALGRDELAERALARAEELLPTSPDPAFARATLLLRRGRRAEALEAARRALRIDPAHVGARGVASTAGAP